jgi:hypothetical protein
MSGGSMRFYNTNDGNYQNTGLYSGTWRNVGAVSGDGNPPNTSTNTHGAIFVRIS